MKKILAIAVALLTLTTVSAQKTVERNVNYYGVDFSKTKVFGADETGYEFKAAFDRINYLVIHEWSKYDPERFLRKRIVTTDISVAQLGNDAIDPFEIKTTSSRYSLTEEDFAEMVSVYNIAEEEGTGLVIVGGFLNKMAETGTFYIVYFDIASREVLQTERLLGRAKGFGLRNHWAGALYSALEAY